MPDAQKFNIYTSKESVRRALSSGSIFRLRMQCTGKLRSFFQYKLPLNQNANALRLYRTDSQDTNIYVKTSQPDKLHVV